MKKEDENLEALFKKFDNQWDVEELNFGHKERFKIKLRRKKYLKNYFSPLLIAASLILFFGFSFLYNERNQPVEFQFASKETKHTDSIFTIIINKELQKLNDKRSPENKKIINDALKQMKILDQDYEKIIKELDRNGESKQIIYAMLSNLQTRISFLQSVLKHVEKNEQLLHIQNEKTL